MYKPIFTKNMLLHCIEFLAIICYFYITDQPSRLYIMFSRSKYYSIVTLMYCNQDHAAHIRWCQDCNITKHSTIIRRRRQ